MASKFCSKCGTEILEGKKFCRNCGKAIAQFAEAAPQSSPAMASSPEPLRRNQCGHSILAGRRFCGKCGTPAAEVAPVESNPSSGIGSPLAENLIWQGVIAEEPPSQPAIPANQVGIVESLPQAPVAPPSPGPATTAGNSSGEAACTEPVPQQFPEPVGVATPGGARQLPREAVPRTVAEGDVPAVTAPGGGSTPPFQKALLFGVAAFLVTGLGAGGLWLNHRRTVAAAARATTTAPAPASSSNAGNSASPAQSLSGPVIEPSQKPSPVKAVPPEQAAPAPAVSPAIPTGIETAAPPHTQAHLAVPSSPTAFAQKSADITPPLAPVTESPRSGTLHYSGAPVPYGGVVVFAKLTARRLRFVYDRTSWQALISRQPDGTQTLTMRSIKHSDQSQCDVHWEVIP